MRRFSILQSDTNACEADLESMLNREAEREPLEIENGIISKWRSVINNPMIWELCQDWNVRDEVELLNHSIHRNL